MWGSRCSSQQNRVPLENGLLSYSIPLSFFCSLDSLSKQTMTHQWKSYGCVETYRRFYKQVLFKAVDIGWFLNVIPNYIHFLRILQKWNTRQGNSRFLPSKLLNFTNRSLKWSTYLNLSSTVLFVYYHTTQKRFLKNAHAAAHRICVHTFQYYCAHASLWAINQLR